MEAENILGGRRVTRQRPRVDEVMLGRFTSGHEQGSCGLTGLPFDAAPEQGALLHPEGGSPGAGAGVRRRARSPTTATAGLGAGGPPVKSSACISRSTRNGHAHTYGPGRLDAVSASTRPCRPGSRLACAPLFCALVMPGAFFIIVLGSGSSISPSRLFRFTHVLSPGRLGRPLPSTSCSDAYPASQRCHKGRIRSLSQERHRICQAPSQWDFNQRRYDSIVSFDYGDAIGEK